MTYDSNAGQASGQPSMRMPGQVKGAIAVLLLQALANGVGALVLISEAQNRTDHGQDGGGTLNALGMISLLMAVLLGVCAAGVGGGNQWAWWLAITLEAIALLAGLVSLFTAPAPAALPGMALAGLVVALLLSPESEQWFRRQRPVRSAADGSPGQPGRPSTPPRL